MNAFTTKEYTAYYTRLPAVGAGARASRLLGDVLTRAGAARRRRRERAPGDPRRAAAWTTTAPTTRPTPSCTSRLFPGHPLGRETAGERDTVARHHARRRPRASSPAGTSPATMVVAVAGGARPRRRGGRGGAPLRRRPAGGDRAGAATPRRPTCVPLAVRRRRTEQVHLALGFRGGARATTPTARRSTSLNHVPRRRHVEPAVRRDPRAARAWPTPCTRRRRPTPTPARSPIYAGTTPAERRRGARPRSTVELEKLVADGLTDDELAVAKGYLDGLVPAGPRGPVAAAWPASAACSPATGRIRPRGRAAGPLGGRRPGRRARAVIDRVLCGPRALAVVGPAHEGARSQRVSCQPLLRVTLVRGRWRPSSSVRPWVAMPAGRRAARPRQVVAAQPSMPRRRRRDEPGGAGVGVLRRAGHRRACGVTTTSKPVPRPVMASTSATCVGGHRLVGGERHHAVPARRPLERAAVGGARRRPRWAAAAAARRRAGRRRRPGSAAPSWANGSPVEQAGRHGQARRRGGRRARGRRSGRRRRRSRRRAGSPRPTPTHGPPAAQVVEGDDLLGHLPRAAAGERA